MLAAACGVCRNFSGCIYSVILGQTIRRAFSFRHTAMQPVCMDRGYCSFGFHEKMGDISNTLTRWMAAKSWGLYLFHYLFIAMTAYYLTMYTKLPAVLLYLFVAAAGFAGAYLAYEIIRRIPVLRWIVCGIGGKKK